MKKRILALLLALVFVFALAACGSGSGTQDDDPVRRPKPSDSGDEPSGESPAATSERPAPPTPDRPGSSKPTGIDSKKAAYGMYEKLTTRTRNIGSDEIEAGEQYDMDMNMYMDMSIEFDMDSFTEMLLDEISLEDLAEMGMTIEEVIELVFDEIGFTNPMEMSLAMFSNTAFKSEGDTFQYAMVSETIMSFLGMTESTTIETYSDGNVAYIIEDGYKTEISMWELMDEIWDMTGSFMPDFDEMDIYDYDIRTIGSDTLITIMITGSALDEFAEEMISAMDEADVYGFYLNDVELTILVDKDENPKEMSMYLYFEIEMDIEGLVCYAIAECEIEMVFNKYGSGVVVDLSKII